MCSATLQRVPNLTSLFVCDALTVKKILWVIKMMKSLLLLVLISICWADHHSDNYTLDHDRVIHIQGKKTQVLMKVKLISSYLELGCLVGVS